LCHTDEQAAEVKARLAAWLTPKGLAFNEGKTRIVHLDDGFDFLGYNLRRYHGKLQIKPSKAAVRQLRERLTAEVKALNGANATAVISRLNPIIRAGLPTTGTPCPAARPACWTTMCGGSPTGGPSAPTQTNRRHG
jgi:RNA-directed DNA polymerase